MPFTIRKVPNKKCYRVSRKIIKNHKKNKRIFSKCTSLKNAQKQLRLLHAIDYNKNFVPYSKMKKTRKNRKV